MQIIPYQHNQIFITSPMITLSDFEEILHGPHLEKEKKPENRKLYWEP